MACVRLYVTVFAQKANLSLNFLKFPFLSLKLLDYFSGLSLSVSVVLCLPVV